MATELDEDRVTTELEEELELLATIELDDELVLIELDELCDEVLLSDREDRVELELAVLTLLEDDTDSSSVLLDEELGDVVLCELDELDLASIVLELDEEYDEEDGLLELELSVTSDVLDVDSLRVLALEEELELLTIIELEDGVLEEDWLDELDFVSMELDDDSPPSSSP